jgi:hypothetical protein
MKENTKRNRKKIVRGKKIKEKSKETHYRERKV